MQLIPMHATQYFEITRHTHVFQPGSIVEVRSHVPGRRFGEADAGYFIPDTGFGLPGALPSDAARACAAPEIQEAYLGKCVLTQLTNFQKPGTTGNGATGIIKPEHVRAVHYNDCQQIYFHMPKYAYDAGTFRFVNRASGQVIEQCAVRERINGTTMILINTLPYPPGFYEIEADWPDGWTHRVRFIKFIEGFPNASYPDPPANIARAIRGDDQHLLPLPETLSRPVSVQGVPARLERAFVPELPTDLSPVSTRFGPALEYTQEGRGGSITYREGAAAMRFEWEFGGGNAVVIIYIPETQYWEAQTGTPLYRRGEILRFVCEQVTRDQAPGCTYKIYDNSISIVR